MRHLSIIGFTALIACGGHVGAADPGVGAPSEQTTVAYPTADLGYDVGRVFPNQAFLGYAHDDVTTTIDTAHESIAAIRMSDYYDPDGARHSKLMFLSVHDVWCGPSNAEEDFVSGANYAGQNSANTSWATELGPKGVRFLTLLMDGPACCNVPATPDDLATWTKHHTSRSSQGLLATSDFVIDDSVGVSVPYNVIIDTRTMRILSIFDAFDPSIDTTLETFL